MGCCINHRTWRNLAACSFKGATTAGDGQFAVVYSARPPVKAHVMLFAELADAEQELEVGHGQRRLQVLYWHPGSAKAA